MTNAIIIFISTAYGLSLALGLVVGITGGSDSPWMALRFASMFVPAVAVLVAWGMTGEGPVVRPDVPWRYAPLAVLLFPVVMHATMLPTMAMMTGLPWEDWLTPRSDGLYYTPAPRGWGTLTVSGLIARLGSTRWSD